MPPHRGAADNAESHDAAQVALAFVDHYLEQVRKGPPPQPEVLRLIASALGVYFGELVIACFGGRFLTLPAEAARLEAGEDVEAWEAAESIARLRVELASVPLRIDPIAVAVAALLPHAAAEEDAEIFALSAQKSELAEPLHAALTRLAPVPVDYYYSFTGRFETLAHIVDILTELLARRSVPVASGEEL